MKTPRIDDIARGNHVVPTGWAKELEQECQRLREERDALRVELNRYREALHRIAEQKGLFADDHPQAPQCVARDVISDAINQPPHGVSVMEVVSEMKKTGGTSPHNAGEIK